MGEQQRVAIARALATDPAFVIADEPTGNLDARNGENVLELIAQLREQTGKTFIIATHDPVVASHADRRIRIVDGLIAEINYINGKITQYLTLPFKCRHQVIRRKRPTNGPWSR